MSANILKSEFLCIISDCAVDLGAAMLAFAPASKIDWTVPGSLVGLLYDFAIATIISVPEWHTTSSKRRYRDDALSKPVHAKVVPQYVEELCDAGVSREFVEAVCACYMKTSTDSETIPSLAEQCAFVRSLGSDRTSDVPERMDDGEENWDFKGMVSAKKWLRLALAVSCGRCSASVRMAGSLRLR